MDGLELQKRNAELELFVTAVSSTRCRWLILAIQTLRALATSQLSSVE